MSYSFDPTLIAGNPSILTGQFVTPAAVSWVRMLIGDMNIGNDVNGNPIAVLEDEMITGVLGSEKNVYLAAARCGEIILAQNVGIVSKMVGQLRLQFDHTPDNAYWGHIQMLRAKGMQALLDNQNKSHSVFVLGRRPRRQSFDSQS